MTGFAPGGDHRAEHLAHAANTPAAGRDEHGLAGPDVAQQACAFDLVEGAAPGIEPRFGREPLVDQVQRRQVHRRSGFHDVSV